MAEDVPVLLCTRGALAGQRIVVPDGGLDIGRSDENQLVIQDDGVSRFHARLLYDNGQLWLQDAGSRNGVFVNNVRVTGHRALQVGDEITIAQHTFAVRWRADLHGSESQARLPGPGEGDAAPKRWWWPFS